jgi:hypothetical protein
MLAFGLIMEDKIGYDSYVIVHSIYIWEKK